MVELEEPDKGRAWVVAISACIINTIFASLSRMIGILYVAVIDSYGVTREEATLPFMVRSGVRCLTGPVVGIVGRRFSIRTVTFGGGVLATTGAILCCIAPNVIWITIFWGGIYGCGFAFANTLFQVAVNQYFHKYRVTASGIALSGACFGSLVLPFLLEEILNKYGLHGAFLIIGGIVMHVLPPAILLTTPQWIQYPKAYARLRDLQNVGKIASTENIVIEEGRKASDHICEIRTAATTSLSDCLVESTQVLQMSTERREMGLFKSTQEYFRCKRWKGNSEEVICTTYRKRRSSLVDREATLQNGYKESLEKRNIYTISGQLSHTDKNSFEKTLPEDEKRKGDSPNAAESESIFESLRIMARLWKNPLYIIISVSLTTYTIILVPIFTVVVDYSTDKGIPASAGKYLINAMAIGDLVGRLCFGWVTDKEYMTMSSFMALLQLLQGASVMLFPFARSLSTFITLLILYGMIAGSILVLFPVLVLQYTSANEQSVAIANVGVLSGIMSFAMPPTIGHFRDVVGSYDGMFCFTGILSILAGGLWLLEPRLMNWYSTAKKKQEKSYIATIENGDKGLVNGHK